MEDPRYLDAEAAAEALGVTLPTLYAYASRGLLRSRPSPDDPRRRRYPREDVERLLERKAVRRDPERAAPRALSWGVPVLESAITLIEGGRLWYRGRDALALARGRGLEEVAALIWTGDPEDAADLFGGPAPRWPAGLRAALAVAPELSPVERCQVALPLAAAGDLAAYDLRPGPAAATGARIVRLLAGVAAGREGDEGGLAEVLRRGWAPDRPAAAGALRAALILCADHELNASAFTARCAASAEAGPWDVVAAGLAALKGRRHGGHTERVAALLREAGTPAAARDAIAARLRRGEPLPGFGHPLYPAGDPRARALLDLADELASGSARGAAAVALARAAETAARELLGEEPTLDLGLVALAGALDLPPRAPLAIFALGRTIGWLGHAIEQYRSETLIRPRARYVGPAPAAEPWRP